MVRRFIAIIVLLFISLYNSDGQNYYEIVDSSVKGMIGKYIYMGETGQPFTDGYFDDIYFRDNSRMRPKYYYSKSDFLSMNYKGQKLNWFKSENIYIPLNGNYFIRVLWKYNKKRGTMTILSDRGFSELCSWFQVVKREQKNGDLLDFSDCFDISRNSYPFTEYYTSIDATYSRRWNYETPTTKSTKVIVKYDCRQERIYVVGVYYPVEGFLSSEPIFHKLEEPFIINKNNIGKVMRIGYRTTDFMGYIVSEEYSFRITNDIYNMDISKAIFWWNPENYEIVNYR